MIARTPAPPYYAVIFTSLRHGEDDAYHAMNLRMIELASLQPGFLGIETAQNSWGVTVSYWSDLASIQHWKEHFEHREAQKLGREQWYKAFKVRVCRVERDYGF